MSAVTIETLCAGFDAKDFAILDLIEQLKSSHTPGEPQTEAHYETVESFLEMLHAKPIPQAADTLCYVLANLRLSFDPTRVKMWDRFQRRIKSYVNQDSTNLHESSLRWFEAVSLPYIATRYGLKAAMLYKLSDGAIDPREVRP